jgi:hypothetical protein
MIYCGSGSGSGSNSGSGSGSESKSKSGTRARPLFSTAFQKKCIQNLAFLLLESALFPRKLASHFGFFYIFYFCIPFYVGSGSNPVPEPELKCDPVPVAPA